METKILPPSPSFKKVRGVRNGTARFVLRPDAVVLMELMIAQMFFKGKGEMSHLSIQYSGVSIQCGRGGQVGQV